MPNIPETLYKKMYTSGSSVKGVEIKRDDYDVTLMVTYNGYQWTGVKLDDDTLDMVIEALTEYKNG